MHRIEAAEPCSDSYDATVARNSTEQDEDARRGIADPPASIGGYDTILIGSPIWNVRPPMIRATSTQAHDVTGTTMPPSSPAPSAVWVGLTGTTRTWCAGVRLGEGFAARGEEVRDPASSVCTDAEAWLRTIGLLTS